MSTSLAPTPSPRQVLFVDLRHICCGDLRWLAPSGDSVHVTAEGTEPSPVRAEPTVQPRGVRFQAEPARKMDLETPAPPGSPVFYDGGRYRTWDLVTEFPSGQDFGAYAQALPTSAAVVYWESTDGYEWIEKARTPIDALDQSGFDGKTFFIDDHAPPAERYKFIYCAIAPPGEREALMTHISDTDTTITYSATHDRYLMYTRSYSFERREIALAESEDFWHWTPVRPLIWQELNAGLCSDIYTNGYSPYPGQPEYHLMFPMIYNRSDQRSAGPPLFKSRRLALVPGPRRPRR